MMLYEKLLKCFELEARIIKLRLKRDKAWEKYTQADMELAIAKQAYRAFCLEQFGTVDPHGSSE